MFSRAALVRTAPTVSSFNSLSSYSSSSLLTSSSSLTQSCNNQINNTQTRLVSSKALRMRMVAVNNIKKITKAMKMVASAKLRKTQDALAVARNFVKPINQLWDTKESIIENAVEQATATANDPNVKGKKYYFVAITADRGLCGSVNSAIARAGKAKLTILTKAADVDMLLIGEKGRASLERGFSKNFELCVTDYTKLKKSTFKNAAIISNFFLEKKDYENGEIISNRFKNLMTFDTISSPIVNPQKMLENNKLSEEYELEGESETLENMVEFRYAVRFFGLFAESETVELSQKVNAMTSSNKNAGEMLDYLRLKYNRGRQAKITTELIEIISGATAAENSNKQDA